MRETITFNPTEIDDVLKYFILSRLTIPLVFLMLYFEQLNIFIGLGIAATSVILIAFYYFHKNTEDAQNKLIINLDTAVWGLVLGIFLNILFDGYRYIVIIQPLLISLSAFLIVSNLILLLIEYKKNAQSTERDIYFDPVKKIATFITIFMVLVPLFVILTSEKNHLVDFYNSIEWEYPAFKEYEFDFLTFMGYYGILVLISIIETTIFILIIKKIQQFNDKEISNKPKKYDIFAQVMKEFSPKNWLLLFILLLFASLWEEVLFRFVALNILAEINIPFWGVIIITSLIFGIAHRSGGIMHIISSFNAGIIFGIVYFNYGIFYVWLLHLFWNILVMVQLWILQALKSDSSE